MVMIVRDYHAWTYAILFFIIFCETGLVVTLFFPVILLPSSLQELFLPLPDMPISAYTRYHLLFAAAGIRAIPAIT